MNLFTAQAVSLPSLQTVWPQISEGYDGVRVDSPGDTTVHWRNDVTPNPKEMAGSAGVVTTDEPLGPDLHNKEWTMKKEKPRRSGERGDDQNLRVLGRLRLDRWGLCGWPGGGA